jgi:hypothetical protein
MNLSASSPRLGRVREYADKLPEPPPLEYVEELVPGDLVLLLDETPERTEPFWAEIEQILGPGWYLGRSQGGEGFRFNAEHVADLDYRRRHATMGDPWYDAFRQEAPKPKKPVTGVFQVFAPGARRSRASQSQGQGQGQQWWWAKGQPPPPPPPPQAAPAGRKESVFDVFKGWFKGKRKVETQPIPPEERRKPRGFSFLPFAGIRDIKESAPEVRQEEPPSPPPIIIPPARPSGGGVIVVSDSALQPISEQLPDDLFSVLGPSEEERPLPPTPSGGIIMAPEKGAPEDLFSVLGPSEEPPPPPATTPGTVIMAPERGGLAVPGDVFSVLEPEAPSALSVPGAPSPFDILSEEPPPGEIVVRPESGGAITESVFDVLAPEQPAGGALAVPGASSPFDLLAPGPEARGGRAEPTSPVEPPPRETKSKRPSERKQKKSATSKLEKWNKPLEHWLEWFKETYNFQELLKSLRREVSSANYIEAKEKEAEEDDEGGEPAYVYFETWADWEYEYIFDFLGIPGSVWEPYMEVIQKEEVENGYSDSWELLELNLIYPAVNGIAEAWDHLKPKDLSGTLGWAYSDFSGTFGIMYYESIPPEKLEKKRKEAKVTRDQILRERKDLEKKRQAKVKALMGPMPKVEDLVSWIEEHWDIDAMFKAIQAERKKKTWKEEMRYGGASMTLEVVVDLSTKRAKEYEYEVAAFFGIPPGVVDLYADAESNQDIWTEIFWPFLEILSSAFDMLLPYANLPGRIIIDENENDELAIQYTESEQD